MKTKRRLIISASFFYVYIIAFIMAVTNYKTSNCGYKIGKLDKVVFLLDETQIGNIKIDNGEAYVASANTQYAIELDAYSISINEGETIDERYEFSHTLNFSVNGYVSINDLSDHRYVVVRDIEGIYWILNPVIPCKVTYTYTLADNQNHTGFILGTKSNFPLLRLRNFSRENASSCKPYSFCNMSELFLNISSYSRYSEADGISYTNDGFKDVIFNKKSLSVQESFDGNNVSHVVDFKIDLSAYKSSWHYNLLEFLENRYAAVITTDCGINIATGFGHGLQPSYTITASDGDESNIIDVKLSDLHDQGQLIHMPSDVPFSHNTGTTWNWVPNEYVCVSTTQAKHLLEQEYDVYGNPKGLYRCLVGYEDQYAYLGDKLVGTFNDEARIYFNSNACKESGCKYTTSIPDEILFTKIDECKKYNLKCDSDWTISTSNTAITVSPSSGEGGEYYNVQICNTETPTSVPSQSTITLSYCDGLTKTFDVVVKSPTSTECLPKGEYYYISTDAQQVIIPTPCCVNYVDADNVDVNHFQIQDGYVSMRVNENNTGSERTITVTLTKCDGTTFEAYIVQDSFFSRWVLVERICYGKDMCDFERMYSGMTSDDINTPTNITRWTNCEASEECKNQNTKWVETTLTQCNNGKLYILEQMQISYDNGETWINTGYYRYGDEIEDVSGQCEVNLEHWKVVPNDYICNDTTKYTKERLYIQATKDQPEEDWTPTDTYRRGDTVIEYDSLDCGGGGSGYLYQEWRTEGTLCNGYDLYTKQRKYFSNDAVEWVASEIYRQGDLIEANSPDCGYESEYEYRWILTDELSCGGLVTETREISGDPYCNASDKYIDIYKQVSYNAGSSWITVLTTPVLVEPSSTDCIKMTLIDLNLEDRTLYCDGNPTLTREEVFIDEDWDKLYSIVEANIGDCVTKIGSNAFKYCHSLTSVQLPSTITEIGVSAFYNCYSLGSFVIPDGVRLIQTSAFYGCSGMTSVTIPSSVTVIGSYAFEECRGLTTLDIPSSVQSIGSYITRYCINMNSIYVRATTPPSILTGAFGSTSTSLKIYVPAESVNLYKNALNWTTYSSIIYPIP